MRRLRRVVSSSPLAGDGALFRAYYSEGMMDGSICVLTPFTGKGLRITAKSAIDQHGRVQFLAQYCEIRDGFYFVSSRSSSFPEVWSSKGDSWCRHLYELRSATPRTNKGA